MPAGLDRFIVETLRDDAASGSRLAAVDRWQKGEGTRRLDPADGRALLQPLLVAAAGPVRSPPARPKATSAPSSTAAGNPVGDECIAVVCPGETLARGYASTYVRVWERTANVLGDRGSYVRCTPQELAAMVETGAVSKAVIQRNAIPRELVPRITALCEAAG